MSFGLTQGMVKRMADPETSPSDDLWNETPVLQVVMLKEIVSNKNGQQSNRKRGAVSDGHHYVQVMFTTQLNGLIDSGSVKRNTLIKITKMTLNVMQDKRLIVLLGIDVQQTLDHKIGCPTAADGKVSLEIESEQGVDLPAPVAESSTAAARVAAVPARIEPKAASAGEPAKAPGPVGHIYPIEALSPYQNKWTIKARVTNKSEVKSWANQRGDGKLFSVTFMDETGEIRATGFNKAVDALYEKFQEDKVYYVSKARVSVAKKKFSNLPNEYEITMEPTTEVEEAADDANVPVQKYNFTPLKSLIDLQKDDICDVLGIVKDVGDLNKIMTKMGQRELSKRDLSIVDQSGYSVRLTLWGKQAENYSQTDQPVIAFKGVKVGDFGGRTLSLLGSGSMTLDPDMEMAHRLRGWYDAQGSSVSYQSYGSGSAGASGAGGGSINRSEMMTLEQVKESTTLGLENQKEFFACKSTVMHIRGDDRTWYPACETCNKKAVLDINEKWSCEKCSKTFDKPSWRYMLNVAFADNTSQAWFTAFNEAAHAILGKSANELFDMKNQDESAFNNVIKGAVGKTYLMSCRAKQDTYQDQPRMRYSITRIQPVDYLTEAQELIKFIDMYP